MKKIVTLTGNDVKRMIYEAVQEISYGTLMNASQMGLDTERVEKALRVIESQLDDSASGYENAEANKYYQAALNGVEAIRTYFQRKQKQTEYFNDVFDSARSMRNNEDDYEDNRPITQAEYQDADDDRARRAFIKDLNNKFVDAVHKKGGWSYPDGVMPRVSNWWTGRQTDKINVQVYNDYYDEMSDAVETVMAKMGFNHYDDEDNSTVTVMKFAKVKQQ
jgi:hypothetical protein